MKLYGDINIKDKRDCDQSGTPIDSKEVVIASSNTFTETPRRCCPKSTDGIIGAAFFQFVNPYYNESSIQI